MHVSLARRAPLAAMGVQRDDARGVHDVADARHRHAGLRRDASEGGARIGRGVYMDTTDLTEFDCVTIGEHSELNALCCPQTHLFEDRVMKVDHVRIGSRVTLGARCTVLYGASVADGAQLGPLTLVMKGESIPAHTRWHGLPAAPWR